MLDAVARPSGPPPVRLVATRDRPSAFLNTSGTVIARVQGDGLRAFDVRDGDHVVLAHRDCAEHGDLAAVLDGDGQACLWKVYPESDGLRLSMGHPAFERHTAPDARVQGVVVAVWRRFREEPSTQPCE